MYQKILVPLDGSPLAEVVLPYVYKLAAKFDAKVTLLHVCQPGESGIFMCEAYVKHLVESAEEQFKLKKGMLDSLVVTGSVHERILEHAEKTKSELVLMAAHGYSGRSDWMLGSVTHKVVAAARTPVLIVREALANTSGDWPQKAIVPLDGSSLSETVLPHVVAIARTGVGVTLLRVCEPPVLLADYPESALGEGWEQHLKLAKQGAENACRIYLNDVATKKLEKEGVKAESAVILANTPADGIVEHIGLDPAALVVMSTHGRSGFSRWPYGHVADRILLAARNPILLVRPRKQ